MAGTTATLRKIRPNHPGEMLREDFLSDSDLTVASLAAAIQVSQQKVEALLDWGEVRGKLD